MTGFNIVVILVCALLIVRVVQRWNLKLPPGPFGLPVIGNAFQFNMVKAWHLCDEYKKRYGVLPRTRGACPFILIFVVGPIVYLNLLGQPVVILNTKKVANDLLVQRAANYSDRPRTIVGGEYLTGGMNMIVARYGEL